MQVIMKGINEIKPYENNPRDNTKAINIVAKSIKEYGFNSPIVVDREMVIINGHTRYEASKRLGLVEVPVVVAEDLSPAKVRAYRIMDNKSSEYSIWDEEKLLGEILDLLQEDVTLDITGFDKDMLANDLGLNLDELEEKAKKKKKENGDDEGRVPITPELLEEHQYVVLYADNTLDWNVLKEKLGLETVRWRHPSPTFETRGLGRVIPASLVIPLLKD